MADGILLRERVGYTEMNRGETGQEKSMAIAVRTVDELVADVLIGWVADTVMMHWYTAPAAWAVVNVRSFPCESTRRVPLASK